MAYLTRAYQYLPLYALPACLRGMSLAARVHRSGMRWRAKSISRLQA